MIGEWGAARGRAPAPDKGGDRQMEVDEYIKGYEARQPDGPGNGALWTYLMHWPSEWDAHHYGLDYRWPGYTG